MSKENVDFCVCRNVEKIIIIKFFLNFSVVDEVTDDKDLPKEERKRLQIVNASHKSPRAKLVKLADKLYNLRDLHRVIPP